MLLFTYLHVSCHYEHKDGASLRCISILILSRPWTSLRYISMLILSWPWNILTANTQQTVLTVASVWHQYIHPTMQGDRSMPSQHGKQLARHTCIMQVMWLVVTEVKAKASGWLQSAGTEMHVIFFIKCGNACSLCAMGVFKVWHHPRPLGYLCAKFCFFRSLHCWASLWRQKFNRRWDTRMWRDISLYQLTYLPLNLEPRLKMARPPKGHSST